MMSKVLRSNPYGTALAVFVNVSSMILSSVYQIMHILFSLAKVGRYLCMI